jgi:hypothetical protein
VICALERYLEVILPNPSTPRSSTSNFRTRTQPTGSETTPNLTLILSSSEDRVGLEDGVSGLNELGGTWLEFHPVQNELDGEGVSVLGYGCVPARDRGIIKVVGVLVRAVGGGLRREEGVGEPVLLDESMGHYPKDLCPSMNSIPN